jgi:hypothetical protein
MAQKRSTRLPSVERNCSQSSTIIEEAKPETIIIAKEIMFCAAPVKEVNPIFDAWPFNA